MSLREHKRSSVAGLLIVGVLLLIGGLAWLGWAMHVTASVHTMLADVGGADDLGVTFDDSMGRIGVTPGIALCVLGLVLVALGFALRPSRRRGVYQ